MRLAALLCRNFAGCAAILAAALFVQAVAFGQEDATAEGAAAGEGGQLNVKEAVEKGEAALKEGNFPEALKLFDQLARAAEQQISQEAFVLRVIALTGRGRALAGMQEYEAALEDFRVATDLQENYVPALLARGQMYLEIENPENYPAALADFQKAIKAERGNLAAQYGFGKAGALTGNYQAAIQPLTRVIEAEPKLAEAYRLRGMSNAGIFKYKEAVDDLQKSISLDPNEHESYFQLGSLYVRQENYRGAVNQIKKAIETYKPKSPEDTLPFLQGHLTLSSVYVELGKNEKTDEAKKQAFQSAVDQAEFVLSKLDEKNPYLGQVRAAALYARGVGERMLGDLNRAVRTFSEAIELNPDMGEAYFRRGICLHHLGEDHMALTDFVESANINYDDPRANLWEGFTQAKLGNYHEAVRAYGNAISASDRYTPAYVNRGRAYMALRENDKAIADFTSAIRLEPSNAEYYHHRGAAHMQLGDFQKAADSFAHAVELSKNHAGAHRGLADALERLGRPQEASQYRQRANQLDPANQPAR